MQILLTNDDGIYAPGLAALERVLTKLGNVSVVAPSVEQSGVGHSITFLTPLTAKEVYDGPRRRGWAVDGSPADSVKLGVLEFCPRKPDLVISGINGGLNAGINVLYSGTVAAAIEGAFFGITSFAVSLEYDEHADFDRAAALALEVIEQTLERKGPGAQLYNLNLPTRALHSETRVRVTPMAVARGGDKFQRRIDPRGRSYFWADADPVAVADGHETDESALAAGYITLTPLHFDMTHRFALNEMEKWSWGLSRP